MRRKVLNLGPRKLRDANSRDRAIRYAEARALREGLVPVLTQAEVAKRLSVTKSGIEQIELRALQKVMDAFRAERELPVDPDAELQRLKIIERKLWQRMNSSLTSGPKSE